MSNLRVLLVDDHILVRTGIRVVMERLPAIEVVGEAECGAAALRMAEELQPHLVMLDVRLPDISGLEIADRISRRFPDIHVIMLSIHDNEEYVLQALRAGADAYLLKDADASEIEAAIAAVMANRTYVSASVKRYLTSYVKRVGSGTGDTDPLTFRQRQVLRHIAEGRSTREIAVLLDISPKTVETHRTRLMERLGIYETSGLTRYALRIGLVPLE